MASRLTGPVLGRPVLLACVAAIVAGGACSGPSQGAPPAAAATAAATAARGASLGAARMSADDVIYAADGFVADRYRQEQSFDLRRYATRRAEYDPRRRCWWVRYERHPNRYPSDRFVVRIDDATGEPMFVGGA